MRRIPKFFFFLVLGVIFGLCLAMPSAAGFSGAGSGTARNPFIITTPAQLNEVRNFIFMDARLSGGGGTPLVHFRLGNDIDLEAYLAPGGAGYAKWGAAGWKPMGEFFYRSGISEIGLGIDRSRLFTVSFDGAGYTIRGLWINRTDMFSVGLFRMSSGVIKNLGVEIADNSIGVRGRSAVGGLVGEQRGGSITNSYVTGDVYGSGDAIASGVGGLVGRMLTGNIINSYATGDVIGASGVGGLVGRMMMGRITNSYATGNVIGTDSVGGLVGAFNVDGFGSITNSYATGDVTGSRTHVGGLVGWAPGWGRAGGSITNSFATGNVAGYDRVGHVMGDRKASDGNPLPRLLNNFRYDGATLTAAGNIVTGQDDDPNGIHGGTVTANQLMTKATYTAAGWEFAPNGPWHWDDRGFPKLNIGEEVFPFRFR